MKVVRTRLGSIASFRARHHLDRFTPMNGHARPQWARLRRAATRPEQPVATTTHSISLVSKRHPRSPREEGEQLT